MGNTKSRNIIHDYEFSFTDGSGPKFDVVIAQMSFERRVSARPAGNRVRMHVLIQKSKQVIIRALLV
jgi:hypothetical protein